MAIREVGLMISGVAVLNKQYRGDAPQQVHLRVIRDGLLSAIQTIAHKALHEEVESFVMSGTIIVVSCVPVLVEGKEDVLCAFAFCDRDIPEKHVKEALIKVLRAFTKAYPVITKVGRRSYAGFEDTLDRILGDLVHTPEDRVALLF